MISWGKSELMLCGGRRGEGRKEEMKGLGKEELRKEEDGRRKKEMKGWGREEEFREEEDRRR